MANRAITDYLADQDKQLNYVKSTNSQMSERKRGNNQIANLYHKFKFRWRVKTIKILVQKKKTSPGSGSGTCLDQTMS